MAIRKMSTSRLTNNVWYKSALAGNEPYSPTDMFLLETTVLGGNTVTVSFNNLSNYSQYKHLQIRAVIKSTQPAYQSAAKVTFNNYTTSGQVSHYLSNSASTISSSSLSSSGTVLYYTAGDSGSTWSGLIMDILDFSSTTKNKTTSYLLGFSDSTPSIVMGSSSYPQTTAINSISIAEDTGNAFKTGSRFSLYGIK